MRCGVNAADRGVVRGAQDVVATHQDGADRHFAGRRTPAGKFQRDLHEGTIGIFAHRGRCICEFEHSWRRYHTTPAATNATSGVGGWRRVCPARKER